MRSASVLAKFALSFLMLCLARQPVTSQKSYTSPAEKNPIPTFQSTMRLVVLDVVVTDKRGTQFAIFGKGDFTIVEDGQRQTIAWFKARDHHPPVAIGGAPVDEKRHCTTRQRHGHETRHAASADSGAHANPGTGLDKRQFGDR
jgi:hypothetical protein